MKGGNKNDETTFRGWLLSSLPSACVCETLCARAEGRSPAPQRLGQHFASAGERLGSSSSFGLAALRPPLGQGAGWCLPSLPSAGPLVTEKQPDQSRLQSHPSADGPAGPIFLATLPCTFLGKRWLLIKEAIAVSQTEWDPEPLAQRSDSLELHSRSELLSQHPWLLKSQ